MLMCQPMRRSRRSSGALMVRAGQGSSAVRLVLGPTWKYLQLAICPGPGPGSDLQSDTTPEVEALHPPPGPPPPLYRGLQESEVLGPSHWSPSSSHRMTQAPTQSFNGEDIYWNFCKAAKCILNESCTDNWLHVKWFLIDWMKTYEGRDNI